MKLHEKLEDNNEIEADDINSIDFSQLTECATEQIIEEILNSNTELYEMNDGCI